MGILEQTILALNVQVVALTLVDMQSGRPGAQGSQGKDEDERRHSFHIR